MKVPVSSIPIHLFINILQKMTIVTWIRMRRTCKAVFDLVVEQQHKFRFRREIIYIKCCTASNMKWLVLRYDREFGTEADEINVKNAKIDCAGLVFDEIMVCPIDADIYSKDDWNSMSTMLGSFLEEAPLRGKVLQIAVELELAGPIAALFPSIESIDVYLLCDMMIDYRFPETQRTIEREVLMEYYYADPVEVLFTMEKAAFKHFSKLQVNMRTIGSCLFPLFRRLNHLFTIEVYSQDDVTTQICISKLLLNISNGSYDLGLEKHFEIHYFSTDDGRRVEGKVFNFPELEGVEGIRIWHTYQHCYNYENHFSTCVLIETPNYSAFITLLCRQPYTNLPHCSVDFVIDIRREFSAEDIAGLLTDKFPYLKEENRLECIDLIRERNWKELGDHAVNHLKKVRY